MLFATPPPAVKKKAKKRIMDALLLACRMNGPLNIKSPVGRSFEMAVFMEYAAEGLNKGVLVNNVPIVYQAQRSGNVRIGPVLSKMNPGDASKLFDDRLVITHNIGSLLINGQQAIAPDGRRLLQS